MATRISGPAQEVFWSQATPLDQRMDTFVPLSSLPLVAFVVCSLYEKSTMVSPVASMLYVSTFFLFLSFELSLLLLSLQFLKLRGCQVTYTKHRLTLIKQTQKSAN